MTRRDYQVIAGAIKASIKKEQTVEGKAALIKMVDMLCEDIHAHKPTFRADLFKKAAGVSE